MIDITTMECRYVVPKPAHAFAGPCRTCQAEWVRKNADEVVRALHKMRADYEAKDLAFRCAFAEAQAGRKRLAALHAEGTE